VTVSQLLDRWLEHNEVDFSPKTVLEMRGYIRRTIVPVIGDRLVSEITTGVGREQALTRSARRGSRAALQRHGPQANGQNPLLALQVIADALIEQAPTKKRPEAPAGDRRICPVQLDGVELSHFDDSRMA
jgi:hypothetical protein